MIKNKADNMNKKVRIAVLVSGNGTNLQALINAQKNKIIRSGNIELVISNNSEAFALKRAEKSKIPFEVISKKEYRGAEAFEKKLKEILKLYKIEFIVLAGFMSILSKNFIKSLGLNSILIVGELNCNPKS